MITRSITLLAVALVFACAGSAAQEDRPRARIEGHELGALPREFGQVRWPALPEIQREVRVAESGAAERAASERGTRIVLTAPIDRLIVRADDVEIRMEPGARIGELYVDRGHSRFRATGGRYGSIELAIPAQFVPPPASWREEWLVSDVTIEGVEIDADNTGLLLRGRRIAIVNNRVRARRFALWCGDTTGFHSEDLVIAGNTFDSAGPESTVRLVDVRRAIVVENDLSNTVKHDFRVHGDSDRVLFARNRLVNTGIMIGSMDGDRIGSVWLLDNTVHHTVPSLLEAPPDRIDRLVARGNHIFSDRWSCFVCARARGWSVGANPIAPYRPLAIRAERPARR